MKSEIFKNILRTVLVIFVLSTISLTACSCDGETLDDGGSNNGGSNGSVNETENNDTPEIGSGEVDGVEGELEGTDISFSESSLTYYIAAVEYKNTVDNIYDEQDCALGFSISKEDEFYLNASLLGYTAFEAGKIYEFTGEKLGLVSLTYYLDDGEVSSGFETVFILFNETPKSVGQNVSGEMKLMTHDGDTFVVSFNSNLVSQSSTIPCEYF